MNDSSESMGASEGTRKASSARWGIWAGFAAILFLYWFTIRPRASSIEWVRDLPAAAAQAQQTHQPILLAFEIPSCGACDWMSREVFPRKDVAQALKKWVAVQVDAESSAAVSQRFGVVAFPTFIALSSDGRPVRRYEGAMTSEEFMFFISEASKQLEAPLATRLSS